MSLRTPTELELPKDGIRKPLARLTDGSGIDM